MIEQRSKEWFQARAGVITASRVAAIMARTKSGPAASRANMIATLALERFTGQCEETYCSPAMQRGTDLEPYAIEAYCAQECVAVEPLAFALHSDLPLVGCSPDGLVGDDGLVEIKCPSAMAVHLDALRSGGHAQQYRWQLQHQLFVTGRKWVDCVSYDPRYPDGLQLAIVRVFPDPDDQAALADEITKANAEIDAIVSDLRNMTAKGIAAE